MVNYSANQREFSETNHYTWNAEQDHALSPDHCQAMSKAMRATTDESLVHRDLPLKSSTISGRLTENIYLRPLDDVRQVE